MDFVLKKNDLISFMNPMLVQESAKNNIEKEISLYGRDQNIYDYTDFVKNTSP